MFSVHKEGYKQDRKGEEGDKEDSERVDLSSSDCDRGTYGQ